MGKVPSAAESLTPDRCADTSLKPAHECLLGTCRSCLYRQTYNVVIICWDTATSSLVSLLYWLSQFITIVISTNKELDRCSVNVGYNEGKNQPTKVSQILATSGDAWDQFSLGICQLNKNLALVVTRHRVSTSTRWHFAFGATLSLQWNPCTDCKSTR